MLILMGPSFAGTDRDYSELSRLTELLAYDLRTRIRQGVWSVLRPLADAEQALRLTRRLQAAGFPAVLVDAAVAHDPARHIVPVERLELGDGRLTLQVPGQTMSVEHAAILTLIRGEVQPGVILSASASSTTLRAVVPSAGERQVFREAVGASSSDAYPALDIHFASVLWVARIDARRFHFSMLSDPALKPAAQLDQLAMLIGNLAGVRVDRGSRTSSVASFASRPPPMRSISPSPGGNQHSRSPAADPRFDAYSRVIGEAERSARSAPAGSANA